MREKLRHLRKSAQAVAYPLLAIQQMDLLYLFGISSRHNGLALSFCPYHFIFLKYLFIYLWLQWVFVAAQAFSRWGEHGLLSTCGVRASYCGGFFCCRAWDLEHRLSSCVRLSCSSMWGLPGLEMELVSLALQGGFLTTGLQGSPYHFRNHNIILFLPSFQKIHFFSHIKPRRSYRMNLNSTYFWCEEIFSIFLCLLWRL